MCVLEAIYEPTFSQHSFGFRPGLGVHDTLMYVDMRYKECDHYIRGDFGDVFDEMDGDILLSVLRERIDDEAFLALISQAIDAGYFNMWKVPETSLPGTPEGSVVGPILMNILLDKFDKWVESEVRVPPPDPRAPSPPRTRIASPARPDAPWSPHARPIARATSASPLDRGSTAPAATLHRWAVPCIACHAAPEIRSGALGAEENSGYHGAQWSCSGEVGFGLRGRHLVVPPGAGGGGVARSGGTVRGARGGEPADGSPWVARV